MWQLMLFSGALLVTVALALQHFFSSTLAIFAALPLIVGAVLLGFGWARARSLPY